MSKSKEYVKNTTILLLGKFTTQFISLLLVPLYTKKLETGDYGTIDLIQTYITLFVPVLTLRLDSSSFRFLIDCRKSKKETRKAISNVSAALFVILIVAIIIAFSASGLSNNIPHYWIVCLNILVLIVSSIFLQILRGLGRNIHYSIASIITGVSALVINILLITACGWGAESILVSSIISNILCIIFVAISARLWDKISIKLIDKVTIKEYLRYSIPMIPNSLSWWIVNVSDRTLIRVFLGAAYNGIYTVSCKFSNILNSVFSVFNISWQESASLHIDDDDRDEFFTSMINKIFMLFSSVALVILVALPVFYNMLIGEKYWSSYDYIPVLLYANSWSVLISLIGGIYVAKMKTKEIASTTIMSAVINIVINLLLINVIGLHAATISTLVSYMAMAIYRAYDCRKYVKYKLDVKGIVIFTLIFSLATVCYMINNPVLNVINIVFAALSIYLLNRKNIKQILSALKVKRKHKHIIDE